jgi:uncharacterized protein with ParB-like and HNH nuclease domain
MSRKTIGTLFELLEEYKVEVPVVQRDYAQGRTDDHANLVRFNLLKDMKSAIMGETPPLDLNFVYGKAEGDKFIPLDGQQRLTTLFLLHLYAFYKDANKTKLLYKLTYETRKSSRDFLEKLTENRLAVFTSDLPPSKEIEESEWFVSVWKYDPTIQSILIMLDDIKNVFCDVENLDQRLTNYEYKPVVFNFLEMKDLGMEDSLYIKLNARGKPLTSFENFKARLIGRLQKLQLNFTDKFEQSFDSEWTDLFWSNCKENFDQTYLMFFGVLLMNKGICLTDINWSNTLDYEKIDEKIYKTAFYTLNFLSNNHECKSIQRLVFNALTEKRTYQDRVLFHAVTTYLYMAKGIDNGSLAQWVRIIKNLTMNSTIDSSSLYRNAINGVNKLAEKWDDLLNYFSKDGSITGFSQDQITEEQLKARIINDSNEFAEEIYKAEQHPYFSGQIRSALYYAKNSQGKYDMKTFVQYWDKISALFDEAKPKHGHLLRQALLTYGDYTLPVGAYKTLCVDDPNEGASTPSMKKLFSNHGEIVKKLLDSINLTDDIRTQLKNIVKNASVLENDWRYCFIKFSNSFKRMSTSHLRLREVDGELIMIRNKSSNGYNYEVFLEALHQFLKHKGLESTFDGYLGTWEDRYLCAKGFYIRFKNKKFIIKDEKGTIMFETKTDYPIGEVAKYIEGITATI